MDIQKEREAFEEYIISKHKNRSPLILTQRIQHGFSENYIVQGVQDCWETWQAVKAQAVPEGYVLVKTSDRDQEMLELIDQRDHMEGQAEELKDKLQALYGVNFGEHSSCNFPFQNAIDYDDSDLVLVKKELPDQIAEKMAIDRIDKPRHENDPVWSEIAEQSYKDQVKSKKWEFWRDYKAMIEAQEPAND